MAMTIEQQRALAMASARKRAAESGGILQTGQDIQQGLVRGLTAGFSDELFSAGMVPFEMAKGAITGKDESKGFVDRIGDAYSRALEFNKRFEREAQERSPIGFAIGEIGGGMALPVGAAAPGATLAQQALRGAKVGAAYGGAYGIGTGETIPERAIGGISGVLTGGTLGAAAPVVTEGVVRGAGKLASPLVQAFRGARDPEAEAARRVTESLRRDLPQGTGLTPQQFAGERAAGAPVTLMEMGGETTRALARSAANTSPEGRAALQEITSERFQTQAPRIAQWFEDNFNVKLTSDVMEKLQTEARKVNRPAYQRAYEEGSRGIWTEELAELVQAPEVQNAIRIAQTQARNWAVKEGFKPPVGAFRIEGGRTVLSKTENGNTVMPSLQLLDYVKRALDQMESPTARSFAKTLRDHLDEIVPSYQNARAGAAKYFGKQDALEAGAEFATMRADPREAFKVISKFSPDEKKLFETGFVSTLVNKIRESPDRRSILNQINNNPNARSRIELAIGKQKARELDARLHVEELMDEARKAVQGNSTTARQLAELGLAGGAVSYGSFSVYNQDPASVAQSAIVAALVAGNRRIDRRVSEQVARLLTSNDPRMLQRGFRIVANNQNMLDALRAAEVRLSAPAAQQGASRPPMIEQRPQQ